MIPVILITFSTVDLRTKTNEGRKITKDALGKFTWQELDEIAH
jgi:hypothetical protein